MEKRRALCSLIVTCLLLAVPGMAQDSEAPADHRCERTTNWCDVLNSLDKSLGTQLKMDNDIWVKQNTDIAAPCLFQGTTLTNAYLLDTLILTNKGKTKKPLILCVRGDSKKTKDDVERTKFDLVFGPTGSSNFECHVSKEQKLKASDIRIGNMGCQYIELAAESNKCIAFTSSSRPGSGKTDPVYKQDGLRDSVKGPGHRTPGRLVEGQDVQIIKQIDKMNFDFLLLPEKPPYGMQQTNSTAKDKDYATTNANAGTQKDDFNCNRCFGMNILLTFDRKFGKWPNTIKYEHLSATPHQTKPLAGTLELPIALYSTLTLSADANEVIPASVSVSEDLTSHISCSYSTSPSAGEVFYITPGDHKMGTLSVSCPSDIPADLLAHFVVTTTRIDTGELVNEDIIEVSGSGVTGHDNR